MITSVDSVAFPPVALAPQAHGARCWAERAASGFGGDARGDRDGSLLINRNNPSITIGIILINRKNDD